MVDEVELEVLDEKVLETRGQFRGRLLIFSARSFKVLGIRY